MKTTDYLIIGAGIIGITVAREIQCRDPGAKVTIIDKEASPGQHASGRNSGVLHSGIYYTSDSLKARFTRNGNRAWQDYCEERGLPLDRCGKLIVTRNEAEYSQLATLEERGAINNVEVQRIDEAEIRDVEPRARTVEHALYVPSTATVDPLVLVKTKQADFIEAGGTLLFDSKYIANEGNNLIRIKDQRISAGTVVNCAGLYADRVARDFGFGRRYTMLPFKGLYLYAGEEAKGPRTHIYPVPDLRHPFLGVHFTRTVTGATKIGPTAIPAFWREHYGGFHGFRLSELLEVSWRELNMLVTNRNDFRTLTWHELHKQRKSHMVAAAATLMSGTKAMGFRSWGQSGIRAQLVERGSNELVMDFVVEGDSRSVHVLNAVSPAFTCAIPFAKYLVNRCLTT